MRFLARTLDRAHEHIARHPIIPERLGRIRNLVLTILHVLLDFGIRSSLWATLLGKVALPATLAVPGAQDALGELADFALCE